MAPEFPRAVRRVTFVLLALAAFAVEVAAADTRPEVVSLGMAGGWVTAAAVLAWAVRPPADPRRTPPRWVFALLAALAAAPFAAEPLRRDWTGDGYPLELQMVLALRNVGLGLAACGGWVLCLRLAGVVSLFLTLFAAAMTNHPAVLVLLGLYTAAGSVWLMLGYWTGLRGVMAAAGREAAVEVRDGRERLPWVSVVVAVGLVGVVLGLAAVGPARAALTLGQWLPTSGGTGDYDPFARGGVNDGDDETRGDNPNGTGMTQTDSFLDSPLPSLYDVFNDMYGKPCPPKDHQAAVALDSSVKVAELKKRPADNLRPNREFPTARTGGPKSVAALGRSARAVFEVDGRTPLHVRAAAFDRFDGRAWHEAPVGATRPPIVKDAASDWMELGGRVAPPAFAAVESHRLKLTAPEGSLIPTPPHLARFRVGRVNRADFFAFGHDRILVFARRKTPSGIVVETESRTPDPRRLADVAFAPAPPGERFDYGTIPPGLNPEVAALAHAWADDSPRGWPQIRAVVDRLRADYTLDPAYPMPDAAADPLAHFLLDARRGPDYQFATAAAVLLRVLGYPTRVVSGFYAHPDHYDPATKHTPVVKEDVHFWPEVMLPDGDWLVVEPTPGYVTREPAIPLSERLAVAAAAVGAWAGRHPVALGAAVVALAVVLARRRDLWDAAAVRRWRWFPARAWDEQVRRAVELLERRGRWAGKARAPGQTATAWLRATPDPDLARLAGVAEWAAYAADAAPPWAAGEPAAACRRALAEWTPRRWAALATPGRAGTNRLAGESQRPSF